MERGLRGGSECLSCPGEAHSAISSAGGEKSGVEINTLFPGDRQSIRVELGGLNDCVGNIILRASIVVSHVKAV